MRTHRVKLSALLLALAGNLPTFAATEATNTNTIQPTLKVNVTVQSAIRLTLATGTQCAVSTGGGADYSINLGSVDALAINTPACGNKYPPTTAGTTPAAYYTDYSITPVFTGQSVATNTLMAYVSSNFTKTNLSIVQSSTAPSAIGDLTAMSTNSGTPTSVAINVTSGTPISRYIGVAVAPNNGASVSGADSATITYTLTVQ